MTTEDEPILKALPNMIKTKEYTCPTCNEKYTNWDLEILGPHHCTYVSCNKCHRRILLKDAIKSMIVYYCEQCAERIRSKL